MSGLGIAAKVAAAGGVLALGLAGAGAAGAAGVLPGPAQDAFDGVVMTFVPADDETDGTGATDECVVDDGAAEGVDAGTVDCDVVDPVLPVGSKEFSEWVQQGAKDPNKIGSEFGESVSEQARELKDEMAGERPSNNGGHGQGGQRVVEGRDPGGRGFTNAGLQGQGPLAGGGQELVERQPFADHIGPAEAIEAGGGQQDGVEIALDRFSSVEGVNSAAPALQ